MLKWLLAAVVLYGGFVGALRDAVLCRRRTALWAVGPAGGQSWHVPPRTEQPIFRRRWQEPRRGAERRECKVCGAWPLGVPRGAVSAPFRSRSALQACPLKKSRSCLNWFGQPILLTLGPRFITDMLACLDRWHCHRIPRNSVAGRVTASLFGLEVVLDRGAAG